MKGLKAQRKGQASITRFSQQTSQRRQAAGWSLKLGFSFELCPLSVGLRLLFSVALLAALACGCETGRYYRQAIGGQWQIMTHQRPIHKLLADTNTPAELKARLELVLKVRQFAERELKLPIDDHYLRYVDLGRRFVVWNVHAAPELSLRAKSWWYPLVGSLDYRGYFSEEHAKRYAAHLRDQGYEVCIGGVTAYSTLGWFEDPVLNTFIFDDEAELVELLFHELAHQRLFLSGDTDFNEAFATAVAEEGLRRWTSALKDAEAWRRYEANLRRNEQFVRLVLSARTQLETVYGEEMDEHGKLRHESKAVPRNPEWQRTEKQRILETLRQRYAELRKEWDGYAGYDEWFAGPLNNAQLNTLATYYELVPGFHRMIASCDGDLEKFYRETHALKKLDEAERHRRIKAWRQ